MNQELEIKHDKVNQRFNLFVSDVEAGEIIYEFRDSKMAITHTKIKDGYEGKGLAKLLVEFAVNYARENKLKIIPICPYVKKIMERTEKFQDMLWVSEIK
jgi:hypothetical protein